MVRLWSEEIGDARSVIEPLVHSISPDVEVRFAEQRGVSKSTAEVVLQKGPHQARCIVTFEAWEGARQNPDALRVAFRRILDALTTGSPRDIYLLTSRGLQTESAERDSDLLHTIAASTEADVIMERFRGLRLRD